MDWAERSEQARQNKEAEREKQKLDKLRETGLFVHKHGLTLLTQLQETNAFKSLTEIRDQVWRAGEVTLEFFGIKELVDNNIFPFEGDWKGKKSMSWGNASEILVSGDIDSKLKTWGNGYYYPEHGIAVGVCLEFQLPGLFCRSDRQGNRIPKSEAVGVFSFIRKSTITHDRGRREYFYPVLDVISTTFPQTSRIDSRKGLTIPPPQSDGAWTSRPTLAQQLQEILVEDILNRKVPYDKMLELPFPS